MLSMIADFSLPMTRLMLVNNEVIQVKTHSNDLQLTSTHITSSIQGQIKRMVCLILSELHHSINPFYIGPFIDPIHQIMASVEIKKWTLRNKYSFFLDGQQINSCPYKIIIKFHFLNPTKIIE